MYAVLDLFGVGGLTPSGFVNLQILIDPLLFSQKSCADSSMVSPQIKYV